MATIRNQTFGDLLKRYRVQAGFTQQELAERAGMSVRGISDLERSVNLRPRRDSVRLLTDALELDAPERSQFEEAAREAALPASDATGSREVKREDVALPPFVGRVEELDALERHLHGAGRRVLILAGEPGIGKSRLLYEARRRGASLGLEVLIGGCGRGSSGDAYAPLPDALMEWIERQPAAGRQAIAREYRGLVQILPELGGHASSATWTLPLEPKAERRLLFRDIARLLTRTAGTEGLLLMFDDLQWAGADVFDALSSILTATGNVYLLGAYRNTEVPPAHPLSVWLGDIARERKLTHLALEPLSGEDTAALLDELLPGMAHGTDSQSEVIVHRAGGVPFFLVSYAEGLRAGAVDPAAEVPWDLAQGIRQRVALLPDGAQRVLEAASVFGRVQVPHLLAAALGMQEDDVVTALDRARRAGLVVEEGASYRFRHDVVRDVVEGDLGAAPRTLLHRRIGEALEREPGERRLEMLAYHWSRSGNEEKAIEYLEPAGDRTWERYAATAAADYFREAAQRVCGVGRLEDIARVQQKLGFALAVIGRCDEAQEALEAAVEAHRAVGDADGEARDVAIRGWMEFARGRAAQGLALVRGLLSSLDGAPPSSGLAELWLTASSLFWDVGDYRVELEAAERARDLARAVNDEHLIAATEGARRRALRFLGRHGEIDGDERETSTARVSSDDLMLGRQDFKLLKARLERTLEEDKGRGNVLHMVLCQCLLGHLIFLMGDWALARRHTMEALNLVRSLGTSAMSPGPRMDLGILCLLEGDWDAASAWLHEALEFAADDLFATRVIQGRLALLDLLQGRPEAAVARLTPVLDRPGLEELQVNSLLPQLAWANLDLGDHARAEAILRDAVRRAGAAHDRIDLVHALLVQARLFARQRRRSEAEGVLKNVISTAREMPYPYAEASALSLRGEMDVAWGEPDSARGYLHEALAIFERLGARRDADRNRQMLVELE